MNLDIIKSEDVYLKAFKYISLKSKSNNLPYHNIDHLVMVFNNAYSSANYYKLDETVRPNAIKELCLSALFHDTNHSGGELSDSENVENSKNFFKEFWLEYNGELSDEDKEMEEMILDIISSTEYPHKDMDLSIQHKLIRDCDMMSFNQDNHTYSTIYGLGTEFGVDVKTQVKNQILFTLTLRDKLYTDWAKSKLENKYGKLMNDLSSLSDLFKDESFLKGPKKIDYDEDFVIVDGVKSFRYNVEYRL